MNGRFVTALVLVASACQPADPAPDYRTEDVEIFLDPAFEGQLCAGDLAQIQGHVDAVASELSVAVGSAITLHLWREIPASVGCGNEGVVGCYFSDTDTAHAIQTTWDHELGHAVFERVPNSSGVDPFFEEGIVESLTGRSFAFPESPALVSEQLGKDIFTVDRPTAFHFMRFVLQADTPIDYAELGSDPDPLGAFEDFAGLPLEDAEQSWRDNSALAYPPMLGCGEPESPLPGGSFTLQRALDCETEQTFSAGDDVLGTCFTVQLDQTSYELSSEADLVSIRRCLSEPVAEPTPDGHVPADYDRPNLLVISDGSEALELIPDKYVICATRLGQAPTSIEVQIDPS